MSEHKPTHRLSLSGRRIPLDAGKPRTWHEIVLPPAETDPTPRNTPHDQAMRQLPTPASLRAHLLNDAEPRRHYDESTAPDRPVEFHGPNRERLRAAGKRRGHRKPSLSARRTTFAKEPTA